MALLKKSSSSWAERQGQVGSPLGLVGIVTWAEDDVSVSGDEAADAKYGAVRPAPRTKSDAHSTVLGRLTGRVALASFVIMSDRRACMRSYPFVTYSDRDNNETAERHTATERCSGFESSAFSFVRMSASLLPRGLQQVSFTSAPSSHLRDLLRVVSIRMTCAACQEFKFLPQKVLLSIFAKKI